MCSSDLFQTDGQAIRGFENAVNSKEHTDISNHPGQFTLYRIAEYDDQTGTIKDIDNVSLGVGSQYVIETEEQIQSRDYIKEIRELRDRFKYIENVLTSSKE